MSKTAKKQSIPSSEERKWNDPNPIGTSENEDESTDTIIEIKKITDVESYMREKFGDA